MAIDRDLHWVLSFYRTSEITGALFFGELARLLRPSAIQQDLTRHFADEAQHARYWTDCLERLGERPLKLGFAYQDKYMAAAGMLVNMMEILAITQVFERRVINQYALHSRLPNLEPEVVETLKLIMEDEKWHLQWIRDALKRMEPEYGADTIQATLNRFLEVDREVYRATADEHAERVNSMIRARK